LDGAFSKAVQTILSVQGRVIVTGMGKSGHVGTKIAATLASTGTPAQFVHPAEASHGDLGMLTSADLCLALSNSGETAELADMISYTRRQRIPLIGITGRAGSTLAVQADVALIIPPVEEACAIGMAPTTSTTCAMALGDALAVALMKARGFNQEAFRLFHPGGSLGALLLTVADIMHTGEALPVVAPQTPMGQVLLVMSAKGFGVALVTADDRLHGIITDGDLRRHLDGLLDHAAAEVCTQNPATISPDLLVVDALAMMNQQAITTLCVADGQRNLLGLVHIHDCLRRSL
jgi:KpsF/GutQ family protein